MVDQVNNDYIINLNTLMLNSGYEINIGENCEAIIFINNSISEKELTIFQKNIICFLNFQNFII